MSDRFARLKTDPRFRKLKKHASKVEIDPRFKTLVEHKPRKGAARIDKYGRKVVAGSRESDTLRRFYRLAGDEDSKPSVDYARGEGLVESSSEEDEEPETDDEEGDVILGGDVNKPISVLEEIDLDESQFAALDAQAEENLALSSERNESNGTSTKTRPTKRIAAVNLDWDHVKASHLFKIFASLVSGENNSISSRGRLLHVRIYPSQFGKKRMAEEDKTGPPAELFRTSKASRNEESNEEEEDRKPHTGEDYDQDALRRYQLERLR
jgi:hypothetical protein